jgi:hypothetical protein
LHHPFLILLFHPNPSSLLSYVDLTSCFAEAFVPPSLCFSASSYLPHYISPVVFVDLYNRLLILSHRANLLNVCVNIVKFVRSWNNTKDFDRFKRTMGITYDSLKNVIELISNVINGKIDGCDIKIKFFNSENEIKRNNNLNRYFNFFIDIRYYYILPLLCLLFYLFPILTDSDAILECFDEGIAILYCILLLLCYYLFILISKKKID